MGLRDRLRQRAATLLGIAAFAAPKSGALSLDDPQVEKLRESFGGQLSSFPTTKTRWYLADIEAAEHAADAGDLRRAGQIYRAMRTDGTLVGVLSTRSGGILALPRMLRGDAKLVALLEGRNGDRSVFDSMFPTAELKLLAEDGDILGVGVGELVPVEGRDYPVFVRLDPEFLQYRWNENRWYYLTIAGPIPITPGDGRWVLHIPGGRVAPWNHGLWKSLARAWLYKAHAKFYKANWEAKLANPARLAYSPQGATDTQRTGFLERLMAWGINQVFELPPGWEAKLLESNGRGYESFDGTMDRSDREYAITIVGQVITIDGGTGFSNQDVHKKVRADLIKATAEPLAHTLNTQAIPPWAATQVANDVDELEGSPSVEWDTRTPEEIEAKGAAMTAFGQGVNAANEALAPYGYRVDAVEHAQRNGLTLQKIAKPQPVAEEKVEFDEEPSEDREDADEPSNVVPMRKEAA